MANNGYLDDPKFEYNMASVPTQRNQHSTAQSSSGGLSATGYAIVLLVLSVVIFFTLGMFSNAMWIVSMAIGIIAHIVAFKGVFNSKGSTASIVVAVISAIPAYTSCLFLLLALVAHIDRAAG